MVKRLSTGPLNMLFATANGDIGYAPGVVFPDRKYKVTHGSFPKQGWKQENSWLGFVDADELPHLVNPASGFIGSCNNRISSERVQHGLTHAHSASVRARRLYEMIGDKIEKGEKFSFKDHKQI